MTTKKRKVQILDRYPKGILHATINGHRYHLRVTEPDKENFLWIDGQNPPLLLNQTHAEMVALVIEACWNFNNEKTSQVLSNKIRDFVTDQIYAKYGRLIDFRKIPVTKEQIRHDLIQLFITLTNIAKGECPQELGLIAKKIDYDKWTAPARLDLALSYDCNLDCQKCYLGPDTLTKKLDFQGWSKVIDHAWEIGVPQIVFTGGEPTLFKNLVLLVDRAEDFVTGLITNGTMLENFAEDLKTVSLDYVQITIESNNPTIHNELVGCNDAFAKTEAGIKAAIKAGLIVTTNTTLTKMNADRFLETIEYLHDLGVRDVACNTLICAGRGTQFAQEQGLTDLELKNLLENACGFAENLGMNLQWYSPTCYNKGVNPIELGLGIKSCSAAGHNMTIRPDGQVLPCQSWPDPVGDFLTDDWAKIWNHPTCVALRNHTFSDIKACHSCVHCDTCQGGCPLDQSFRCGEGVKI